MAAQRLFMVRTAPSVVTFRVSQVPRATSAATTPLVEPSAANRVINWIKTRGQKSTRYILSGALLVSKGVAPKLVAISQPAKTAKATSTAIKANRNKRARRVVGGWL